MDHNRERRHASIPAWSARDSDLSGKTRVDCPSQLGETINEEQHPMPAKKSSASNPVASLSKVKQIGRYIVADPKVCHGKLTFRGTRIFVSDVLEQVERGMPWDTIVEEWEGRLPPE